ncbi:transcription factor bHLH71-like [Magnolia sinica]|uniref:transcription factor bHLH71-like n=1 Tax=Magnolia sinica TaxID=86752 RepID=UPI002659F116|nr:transcription factor bHLH71-like [Magnolia sinica]
MALASTNLPGFIVHNAIPSSEHYYHHQGHGSFLIENNVSDGTHHPHLDGLGWSDFHGYLGHSNSIMSVHLGSSESMDGRPNMSVQGTKKRRRRPKICKDKEEAETQRMAHIFIERNRRKLMNEHLAVLRSMMPDYYLQRGDQASIVGGAINFVKELEQLLQSLEAQKRILQRQRGRKEVSHNNNNDSDSNNDYHPKPPFEEFSKYPQYSRSQLPGDQQLENGSAVADIEVTMINACANLRILSKRRPKQFTKIIIGFQALHLTILHLNVTTVDPFIFYSISAKVEEGCHLKSVDDIAGAVHHMLTIVEEEDTVC